jgi:hypothetical protein
MSGLELFWIGLVNAFSPFNFAMMLTGLTIGVLAGALPGITMLNAIVLVLPFTYSMDIVPSLLLMTAVYGGGIFGGSITGILFNIPGDPMNVPATWEGYALNKKGHVARALGVAIMGSALGGFLSCLVMTLVSPPFAKVALSFSSAEYFAVIFLGLVSVVVINTKSIGSSLIALFLGMLLGTIGIDDMYGAARFTFGSRLLETGINFTIVLIGLFAIGEVFEQLCERNRVPDAVMKERPKVHLLRLRNLGAQGVTPAGLRDRHGHRRNPRRRGYGSVVRELRGGAAGLQKARGVRQGLLGRPELHELGHQRLDRRRHDPAPDPRHPGQRGHGGHDGRLPAARHPAGAAALQQGPASSAPSSSPSSCGCPRISWAPSSSCSAWSGPTPCATTRPTCGTWWCSGSAGITCAATICRCRRSYWGSSWGRSPSAIFSAP